MSWRPAKSVVACEAEPVASVVGGLVGGVLFRVASMLVWTVAGDHRVAARALVSLSVAACSRSRAMRAMRSRNCSLETV